MHYVNVENYCRIRYGLRDGEKPTKAQVNSVTGMCRRGTVPSFKSGRRWIIELGKENEK